MRSGEGRRPAPADWLLVDGALPLDDATAGWLRDRLTAATPGHWMYHCHILEQAEDGMLGEMMVE